MFRMGYKIFLGWLLVSLFLYSCATTKLSRAGNFSTDQTALIMQGDSLTPMRVYKITNRTDSVLLRQKSIDVKADPTDPILKRLVRRLYQTVRDSLSMGVGIAAPQVGILKNIIWVQRFDKPDSPFEVYLNPRIVQYSKKTQQCPEGCLSIPNRREVLNTRSYAILLEYDRMDNTHIVEMIEDFTAVIFQHEIDHFNGILYIDHLEKEVNAERHN